MNFRMDHFLTSLSSGLDSVEGEVFGATTHHGKRLGILCLAMGRHLGWGDPELVAVAGCALLHDNALPGSYQSWRRDDDWGESFRLHCIRGEENVQCLPFASDVTGIVKYHHEYADKSGPFEMNANAVPMGAQWIAMTDDLDVHNDLRGGRTKADLTATRSMIKDKRKKYYTADAADALLAVLDENLLESLEDAHVEETFTSAMPAWTVEKPPSELMDIAEIVANITDAKSQFTAKHSIQIANRAFWMARFYEYDRETCAMVYLAAALHDIGKLLTPTSILEKPGKLTDKEYITIMEHALWSYRMLSNVKGFETICRWATTHHRKLNGKGYPNLPEEYLKLDFFSRMMACLDIYQAVRETRPYHPSRSHRETMAIMWEMADRDEIDQRITQDLDREMDTFKWGDGDVPDPRKYDF